MKKRTLYKYRSLSNIKRILEIIIEGKIYASRYRNLNDPMEGYYSYSKDIGKFRKEINQLRDKTLICSLSKSCKVGLLWIMYADEGKGCCIEVEVKQNSWSMIDVIYKDKIPKITEENKVKIEEIFKYKSTLWDYEEEIRYVKESDKMIKLPVKVTKIILGYSYKYSSPEYKFYKSLFEDKLGIKVEIMEKKQIDFGYK